MIGGAERGGLLVVSPHCDDAVFGCGAAIESRPGARVITVFSAGPEDGIELTAWDALAGFQPGDDVMAARREEDRTALAELGARPVWLGFRDAHYAPAPSIEAIAASLQREVAACPAESVLIPLGLFHGDHLRTHAACRLVAARHPERRWIGYADALYRAVGDLLEARLAELDRNGFAPRPLELPRLEPSRKPAAVACYASQLRALVAPGKPGLDDLERPEQLFLLDVRARRTV